MPLLQQYIKKVWFGLITNTNCASSFDSHLIHTQLHLFCVAAFAWDTEDAVHVHHCTNYSEEGSLPLLLCNCTWPRMKDTNYHMLMHMHQLRWRGLPSPAPGQLCVHVEMQMQTITHSHKQSTNPNKLQAQRQNINPNHLMHTTNY